MRISKVIIRNYRNFREFEVELSDNVVLLGENASGKTNFFEALRLVLDPSYHPQLGDSDFHRGIPIFRGSEIDVRVQFADFLDAKDRDFLSLLPGCFIQDDPPIAQVGYLYCPRNDLEDISNATGPDYYQSIRYGGDASDRSNLNQEAARRFRKYVRLKIIPALRDIEKDMSVWRSLPLRRLTQVMNLSDDHQFHQVVSLVKQATNNLQSIPAIVNLQREIQKRLTDMVEGANAFNPQVGLLPTSPDELQRALTLLVEDELSLDRTSLGLANVLYLTLLLLEVELGRRTVKTDTYQYTILAIEEPEAHLHPHLQRLVFRDFLRSEVPILLSTHSSNIVSISQPDWFVLLKKHTEGTRATSTTELGKLPNFLKRDLSRYLDATRGEVVFGKGIIIVEGDAEVFLVSEFSRKMRGAELVSYTLDGAGISICNVAGTDFTPYVHFFGPDGLNLPLAVVTDGDKYVGVERIARNLLKRKNLASSFRSRLRDTLNSSDLDGVRQVLEENGQGCFEGLNRGIKIAKLIDREKSEYLRQLYNQQQWDLVRQGLGQLGIFVNDWTLEAELLNSGYEEEFVEVYGELGASKKQRRGMELAIADRQISKVITRIEETGKGKGRFAQRLADRIDAGRIPEYMYDAISFVIQRTSPKSVSVRPTISNDELSIDEEE